MEYNVIQKVTVSGATSTAITTHSDEKSAKMEYHQILASAYANSELESLLVVLMNDNAYIIQKETYVVDNTSADE